MIIDFKSEKEKREADLSCTYKDENGFLWKKYACEFEHEGKNVGIDMWALSDEHMTEILTSFKNNCKILGRIYAEDDNG